MRHPEGPPYIEWQRVGGSHLYAAGKAALDRLSSGLAAELHADGIAVNALALVSGDPGKLTGRIVYSLRLLEELGREIRTLDGRATP